MASTLRTRPRRKVGMWTTNCTVFISSSTSSKEQFLLWFCWLIFLPTMSTIDEMKLLLLSRTNGVKRLCQDLSTHPLYYTAIYALRITIRKHRKENHLLILLPRCNHCDFYIYINSRHFLYTHLPPPCVCLYLLQKQNMHDYLFPFLQSEVFLLKVSARP